MFGRRYLRPFIEASLQWCCWPRHVGFGRRYLRPFIEAYSQSIAPYPPTHRLAGDISGPSLKPCECRPDSIGQRCLAGDISGPSLKHGIRQQDARRGQRFGRRYLRPFIEAMDVIVMLRDAAPFGRRYLRPFIEAPG